LTIKTYSPIFHSIATAHPARFNGFCETGAGATLTLRPVKVSTGTSCDGAGWDKRQSAYACRGLLSQSYRIHGNHGDKPDLAGLFITIHFPLV